MIKHDLPVIWQEAAIERLNKRLTAQGITAAKMTKNDPESDSKSDPQAGHQVPEGQVALPGRGGGQLDQVCGTCK